MQALLPAAAELAAALRTRRQTLAVVESSSGGLISAALLAQPGASAYFVGGAIVYTAAAREGLLGITAEDMAGLRSASEPYARLLGRRIRAKLGADWALVETGAAGPGGNRYGDAAGHCCLAWVGEATELARTVETGLIDRVANMRIFADAALGFAIGALGS